jgi:hypothetical protein
MDMDLRSMKFKRKLSRGSDERKAISLAIPKLFLELMEAEHCQYVLISIEDEDHLTLEMVRE